MSAQLRHSDRLGKVNVIEDPTIRTNDKRRSTPRCLAFHDPGHSLYDGVLLEAGNSVTGPLLDAYVARARKFDIDAASGGDYQIAKDRFVRQRDRWGRFRIPRR